MTVVDTSVWIDALHGTANAHTRWLNGHLMDTSLALTDLVLCEVLQGIRNDALFIPFREDLLRFMVFDTCGAVLAVASAENYRALQKRGITVRSTIDCLVATFCIREGHDLLHRDRDFEAFERHLGLSVVHP